MWILSSLVDLMCIRVKLFVVRNFSFILLRFCILDELWCGEYYNFSFVIIESYIVFFGLCIKLMDSVR